MSQSELWFAFIALGLAVLALNFALMASHQRWTRALKENSDLRLDNEKAWNEAQYYRVRYEDMELRERHRDEIHRRQINELQKALTVVQESSTKANRHNENT